MDGLFPDAPRRWTKKHSEAVETASLKLSAFSRPEFDYAGLDQAVAVQAQQAADRIRARQRDSAIEIGRELLGIKEALQHGHFIKWLGAEFDWTERSAQNFMQLAAAFPDPAKYETVSYLPTATLYKLTSPATPRPVLDAVIQAADAGQRIATGSLNRLISESRVQQGRKERRARAANPSPEDIAKEQRRQKRAERARAEQRAEDEAKLQSARRAAQMVRDAIGAEMPALLVLLEECKSWEFVGDLRALMDDRHQDGAA